MVTPQPQQTEDCQTQKPYLSQVPTPQYPLSQVPINQMSLPVSHRGPPVLVQMTQIQIPHPAITHSPLQAKLQQAATEQLDPDYQLITMRPRYNAYMEDPK